MARSTQPETRDARRRARRSAALTSCLVAVGALLWALAAPAVPAAASINRVQDSWAVTKVAATPATNLSDGKRVSINVKTTDPNFVIEQAQAQVCRAGVAYGDSSTDLTNDDFRPGGANCPPQGISTSASAIVVDNYTNPDANTPDGETFTIHVGTGPATWINTFNAQKTSLTCDQDHPCSLVVELNGVGLDGGGHVVQPLSWHPYVTQLTYIDSNPIQGCGGPADGILTSSGSDALQEAWIGWSLAACKLPGQKGALTNMSFTGESPALSSFLDGVTDIAYTGVGYNAATKMTPVDADAQRPAIAVPIGLNAVVLGLGGGYIDQTTNRYRPYDRAPDLTIPEMTTLLAGGPPGNIQSHLSDIYLRNPELASPGLFTIQNGAVLLSAPSTGGTTSWLATRYVASLDNPDWVVPDLPLYGDDAGKPRGVDANLALADPSYNNAITLLTGRPPLEKAVNALDTTGGGIWSLTDLTTALALGLLPTSIQNANGEFVAPTADSMAAAVPGMQTNDDGTKVPDPNQTVGYPLTYVQYALVPTQPLADSSNVCRTASQALLTTWLQYITGPGQQDLPAGFAPLTPALKAEAAADIKKVGATKAAKPCTAPSSAPTGGSTAPSGAGAPVGSSAGAPPAAVPGGESTISMLNTDSAPTPVGISTPSSHKPATVVLIANPKIPGFGGANLPSTIATIVGLLGLVLLLCTAAAWSSGWRPRLGRGSAAPAADPLSFAPPP